MKQHDTATPEELVWHSNVCGHQESVQPGGEYGPGDDEPCVHCPHNDCFATVVRKDPRP